MPKNKTRSHFEETDPRAKADDDNMSNQYSIKVGCTASDPSGSASQGQATAPYGAAVPTSTSSSAFSKSPQFSASRKRKSTLSHYHDDEKEESSKEKDEEEPSGQPTITFFTNWSHWPRNRDHKKFLYITQNWKSTADIKISETPTYVAFQYRRLGYSTRLVSFCGLSPHSLPVPILRRICVGVGIPGTGSDSKQVVLEKLVEWKETIEKEYNGSLPIMVAEETHEQTSSANVANASFKTLHSQEETPTTKPTTRHEKKQEKQQMQEDEDGISDVNNPGLQDQAEDNQLLEDQWNQDGRQSQEQVIKEMVAILDRAIDQLEEKKLLLLQHLQTST